MPTPTACCTWKPTRATPAPGTEARRSGRGSTRHPFPMTTEKWTTCSACPMRASAPGLWQGENPAYDMIRFSVNIMRGCFGGCTFCSITEHEGRIIQNRSKSRSSAKSKRSRQRCRALPGSFPTSAGRPRTCTASPARARKSNPRAASRRACSPASART